MTFGPFLTLGLHLTLIVPGFGLPMWNAPFWLVPVPVGDIIEVPPPEVAGKEAFIVAYPVKWKLLYEKVLAYGATSVPKISKCQSGQKVVK